MHSPSVVSLDLRRMMIMMIFAVVASDRFRCHGHTKTGVVVVSFKVHARV